MHIHQRLRPLMVAVLLGVASVSLPACGGDNKPNATPAGTLTIT